MLSKLSTAAELAGLTLIVVAAATVSPTLALALAGVFLVVVGFAVG